MDSWEVLSPYDRLVSTELVKPRKYQIDIIKAVYSGDNTLVVLPTGLGKTLIAIFAIAKALSQGKRALILAPTKPLSEQHYNSLSSLLKVDKDDILLLTGSINKARRREMESKAKVVSATPQTVANDLKSGVLSLNDFGVVIFDECHRAVGRYAYTYIAEESKLRGVQILGMTASPGSNKKRLDALVKSLELERIEARSSLDPDVEPYVAGKETEIIRVDMGATIATIRSLISPLMDKHIASLYSHGLSPFKTTENLARGRLLEIGRNIDKIQAQGYKFQAIYDYVFVLNLLHAYELVSTEGLHPFLSYMESLEAKEKKGRSVKSLLVDPSIMQAVKLAKEAIARGEEHPKMPLLISSIKTRFSGKSMIVFAQYRSTIHKLVSLLNLNGISAKAFVGKSQTNTRQNQDAVILEFRESKFQVLVATSIGEEGLDIPTVDVVVFYEPVPNEIRNIQRKGRAGRVRFGSVIILVTKGTKDEKYLMISRMKERRMMELVEKVGQKMATEKYMKDRGQQHLG